MKLISPQLFINEPQYRQCVIDVRTPAEFRSARLPQSDNVPLMDIQAGRIARIPSHQTVTLVCQGGNRAQMAAQALLACNAACDVVVVEGGLTAIEKAGVALEKRSGVWSLERQVRVVAGALVLIGIMLSFVNPYFLGISGFVGAGLIFAGVTDFCGMALLLARMPWNK